MKLTFISAPEKFKGINSRLYIYKDGTGNKYIYKEFASSFRENIRNELIANRLAKLVGIKTLDFIEHKKLPDRKPGLLMNYLEKATTLSEFKQELTAIQKTDLRKIILFDVWTGNADRHTANVLVTDRLLAFDHVKLFKKSERAADFIKIEVGSRLDEKYFEKMEKLMGLNLTTGEVLIKWFGFKEDDFKGIKNIEDHGIREIVKEPEYAYLTERREKLARFPFT